MKQRKERRRGLSLLLALSMIMSLLVVPASAAVYTGKPIESHYFRDQLNDRARQIYDYMYDEFKQKGDYLNGTTYLDLVAKGIAKEQDIIDYKAGNKNIYNDFCAAKDALDLDHSELWWLDSGYLSFWVLQEDGKVKMEIGPGRGDTYLLGGKTIAETASEDEKVEARLNQIVEQAKTDLAQVGAQYSEQDKIAALVRSVHDQVVSSISYRYEIDCSNDENARYIRTVRALLTHEGVCESYARSMQVCLSRLGVESVLVHGLQTKGTPEDHMWLAVNIPEGETDHWYVTDPTWDDPVSANLDGTMDKSGVAGKDGKENTTYLLVGQSVIGEYWHPSGYVSQGNFEFTYPKIETASYDGSTAFQSENGLTVKYSAGSGSMEEGTPAGVFAVSFQGMSQTEAAKKGFYFLLKMYDYHPDGTYDAMGEWYYASAAMHFLPDSKYFYDDPQNHCLYIYTGTCEYVEVAVTTVKPNNYEDWDTRKDWGPYIMDQFFSGTEDQIIAQSDMLYNSNSTYEAPPYVLSQTPAPNCQGTAGYEYRFDVVFDDDLYHPSGSEPASIDTFMDNTTQAAQQQVRVRYITIQEDLHNGGDMVATIAGELPFDEDRDGYVDMNTEYTDFKWKYKYAENPEECPNAENHKDGKCSVDDGCAIIGVEFNFRASDMWQDDITQYDFTIEGVVGSRSAKFPNAFGAVFAVPGLCPACYRSQGIDWNLWGKPTLLDAPENLDLAAMALEGGTDPDVLEELNNDMNTRGLNGRLMLVVEDNSKGSGNREEYEKVTDKLEEKIGIDEEDVIASSVFEINFNRICPAVKLEPDKGQSLRVQVGYPAGVTYESLGNKVIRAYHFTRCSASNHCEHWSETGHVAGEHIVGVDEIQVIPNPYGMVIICNAFSPFEIVVMDQETAASIPTEFSSADPILTVVSDGHGTVEVDGQTAVGVHGDVTFPAETTKTFTVHPAEGYELDTVSLAGEKIEVQGNQFTIDNSKVPHNDVLSVTFLPKTVKEANAEAETVVAKICTHSKTEITKPEEPATCENAGKTAEITCTECHQIVQAQTVIPAKGHTPEEKSAAVAASCEQGGKLAEVECSTCHKTLSAGTATAPLGHQYFSYEKIADATCEHGIQKEATCERCKTAKNVISIGETKDHNFVEERIEPATCTSNEKIIRRCTECQAESAEEKPGTILAHTPRSDGSGLCENCNQFVCKDGNHSLETIPGKDPTCTENGYTESQKCRVCGLVVEPPTLLLKKNHEYESEHPHIGDQCKNCGYTKEQNEHKEVDMETVEATCEMPGTTGGKKCEICGDILQNPTIVPATGHTWSIEDPAWNWTTDGEPSASVTLTCENDDSHHETFEASIQRIGVSREPSCYEVGLDTYTATVEVPEKGSIENTNTKVPIPMVDHQPDGEPVISESTCIHHATSSFTCRFCGETFTTILDDSELTDHNMIPDPHQTKAATCTEDGLQVRVCSVCEEEETEVISATGHKFENGVCLACGAGDDTYVAQEPEVVKYHVTFMDNDTTVLIVKEVESGKGVGALPVPTGRSGYQFDGWFLDDGTAFTADTPVYGDLTVTPKFTATSTSSGNSGSSGNDRDRYPDSGTTTYKDGINVRETDEEFNATIPSGKKKATLPIEIDLSKEECKPIVINPRGDLPVRVEIPVKRVKPGMVAVVVNEDGEEEIVRDCVFTKDGIALTVDEKTTIRIINNATEFKDEVAWAADAMQFVSAREIFKGTAEDEFSPDLEMSRGMLVTALYRLAYEPEADSSVFQDVSNEAYYADAIRWASANGIVNGYGDGTFGPDDDITREQMVAVLYRYAKLKELKTTEGYQMASFTDEASISSYAVDAMHWAVSNGLVNGMGDGTVAPQANARRAEVATIFMRFCETLL